MRSRADNIVAGLLPRHWYRADTYTLSGGNLAALPNRNTTVGGSMAVSSGTVAAPAADATLGGAQSITFQSATPNGLQSTLPSTEFIYLHDGTGAETWAVFVPVEGAAKTIWGTKAFAAAAEVGAGQFHQTGFPSITQIVGNGTATQPSQISVSGAGANLPTYTTAVYLESAPNEVLASIKDIYGVTAATAAAPSAAAPQSTLRIGRSATDAVNGGMRFAEFLSFNRVLTPYERQLVREYIATRYGIAAPVVSAEDRSILALNPFSWIRADSFTSSGGKVTAFLDKVLPGHSMTQGTVANQVADPTVDATLNGQLSAVFAGGQRYASSLASASWSVLHDSLGVSSQTVFTPISTTNGLLWTTRNNAVAAEIGASLTRSGGQLGRGIGNGTATQPVAFATGGSAPNNSAVKARIFHGASQTPDFVFSANGVNITSVDYAAAPVSTAPTYTLQLGARQDGTGAITANFADFLVFSRLLTAAETAVLDAYTIRRFGV